MTDKTAIIYARVSTKGQADDELPIDGQLEQCRRKAEQLGVVVLREFIDAGVSARSDRRDAFREAVTYCQLHEVNFFVCWSTSRFFREHVEAPKYKRDLERGGTIVTYASVDFDRTTNEGWLTETIYEVFDELYSRQVSVDTMRGMIKNARDGYFNGGRVPFGYRVVPAGKRKRLEPDAAEAPIVREVFALYMSGYGTKLVAMHFNDRGVTKRGKVWNKNEVTLLLKNEVYVGRIVFNRLDHKTRRNRPREDWIVTQSHEPLVSVDDFNAVQETFSSRSPQRVGGQPRSNFAFVGLLTCGSCGSSLQTESATGRSHRYAYYNCRSAQKGAGCRHRRLPAAELDQFLIDFISRRLFSRPEVKRVIEGLRRDQKKWARDREKQRESILRELRSVESALSNLYGVLELHGIDAPNLGDLTERLRELKGRRSRLEVDITRIESTPAPDVLDTDDDIDQLVGMFRSIISNCADGRRRREFFSTVIADIVIRESDVVVRYRPEMMVNRADGGAVHSDASWLPVLSTLRTRAVVARLPERFLRAA